MSKRRPILKLKNNTGFGFGYNWHEVEIREGKDDPKDYPIYGRYYYCFKPGSRKALRTTAEVSDRLLNKKNQELILALKAGLVKEIEL